MRIVRYLKDHVAAVVLIVCLLVVQAFTDLSLPNLTSKIVDVGIQQSGVEHAATDEMSARTFDEVAMMLSADNEKVFRSAYDETDAGTYCLNDEGKREIDELDALVALPLAVVHNADRLPDFDLAQLAAAYDAGTVGKQQILDLMDEAKSQMGGNADALIEQQGIAAARAEYEALGYSLSDMQMGFLLRTGGLMLGLAALGMMVAVIVGFVAARTAASVARRLRARLFERVVSFSESEIGRFSAASLITRATNDVQLVQMVTVMLLRMVLYAPILAVGGIVMITRTNASMGWIIVVAVAMVFALIGVLMKVAMPKFKMMQKLIDRVNLVAREILTGLSVIRAFDREDFEEARFDTASTRLMRTQLFTNRVMTFMMPCMMLIMNAVSVAIVWVGGGYIDAGVIQTGDLIAFITYAMVIIMGFLMIGMISIMLPRADVAAQRIDEVLACEPSVRDPEDLRPAEILGFGMGKAPDARAGSPLPVPPAPPAVGAPSAPCAAGAEIVFDDVSFAYADSAECVLAHVSFTAEAGKTCAIVGSTGSGKSTVVKLIERFYDVTEGAVRIDGIDVRNMPQRTLRAQLGYVPQKAFLFSGTIASNVAYSNESMSRVRIDEALGIAQAAEFVGAKEEGADFPIAQGGTNVSGGQRQRLAIARALATDARAYLFDDSFSALDYKTDAALRREMRERLSGKTVIIVAQRISTVLSADRIVVLDEGRVVGTGTHAELMETCREYQEIARSQLSETELEGGGRK